MADTRLIERWLPIAEIGEESMRERRSMTALPPTYYLHVWWARRPLVASRAGVLASLLPADADREKFLHVVGIHGDPAVRDGGARQGLPKSAIVRDLVAAAIGGRPVDGGPSSPVFPAQPPMPEPGRLLYVWLKRTAGRVFPDLFRRQLTDKENEVVANPEAPGAENRAWRSPIDPRGRCPDQLRRLARMPRSVDPDGAHAVITREQRARCDESRGTLGRPVRSPRGARCRQHHHGKWGTAQSDSGGHALSWVDRRLRRM